MLSYKTSFFSTEEHNFFGLFIWKKKNIAIDAIIETNTKKAC